MRIRLNLINIGAMARPDFNFRKTRSRLGWGVAAGVCMLLFELYTADDFNLGYLVPYLALIGASVFIGIRNVCLDIRQAISERAAPSFLPTLATLFFCAALFAQDA